LNPINGFSYTAGFLGNDEAQSLLKTLWQELSWEQYEIRLFGRRVLQPRLTTWCSDPGVSYRYSGLTLDPRQWHPLLGLLRDKLQTTLNCRLNSVLANAYRDGADSMGWHSDDEPELGQKPLIASVSLGAERRFLVRPKGGGVSERVILGHGSLLLMTGDSQANWQHSIPKTKRNVGLRINLTFRQIQSPAPKSAT
jgi:alkylated DNA repair dioxygenase AlkB